MVYIIDKIQSGKWYDTKSSQKKENDTGDGSGTQRPRTDLDKRFLPRPKTTTA